VRHVLPPPQVSKAKVWVEQAPWKRVDINGLSHEHGEVHRQLLPQLLLLLVLRNTPSLCKQTCCVAPLTKC
jgi:hypothetical protein